MAHHTAVFLDRDDTLIRNVPYLGDPQQVELLPGVADGLRRLREAGYLLILVSNQSGVGRGLISKEDVTRVNQRMEELLGLDLDGIYCCYAAPEDPYESDERKPSPAMLLRAASEHGLSLQSSHMIGDRLSDVRCALAAGCSAIWVDGGTCDDDAERLLAQKEATYAAPDFLKAVQWILQKKT